MTKFSEVTNPYVRRARLQPAMIVVLPIALATLAWFPDGIVGWGILWSVVVACGGTALLAQVARDAGKRKQQCLFETWGGMPSVSLLRHRDAKNSIILDRYHTKLSNLLKIKLPTRAEEERDPKGADAVYETCTNYLLEATRDQKRFALLFEENCNYGFRRNLWGMKVWGIVFAVIGISIVASLLTIEIIRHLPISPTAVICEAFNCAILYTWIVHIRAQWVKIPAEAFGERLLATCEVLK